MSGILLKWSFWFVFFFSGRHIIGQCLLLVVRADHCLAYASVSSPCCLHLLLLTWVLVAPWTPEVPRELPAQWITAETIQAACVHSQAHHSEAVILLAQDKPSRAFTLRQVTAELDNLWANQWRIQTDKCSLWPLLMLLINCIHNSNRPYHHLSIFCWCSNNLPPDWTGDYA